MIDINIVWLKRDIRTQDHEALWRAEQENIPYIIIFLFEPKLIFYKDTSVRHLQFQYYSIKDFNKTINKSFDGASILYGDADKIFSYLSTQYCIKNIFSYEENGIELTWKRDKWVTKFCKENNINWIQFQRNGVLRGIKNRTNWDNKWYAYINATVINNQVSDKCIELKHPFELPETFELELKNYSKNFQPAGESKAWKYLYSFVNERGKLYHKHISKPTESRKSCSRLSPYLAWGNITIRQFFQFVQLHPNYATNKFAFNGMLTRLHWHCHFIQKFETDCSYETLCINKAYELVEHFNNQTFLEAWKTGNTGFPLVDACMRCVIETGWINFRMRAMLVSVHCFNLDLDWRQGVYHLAQQFLDYEPGIHYPQFQMQAGTTGINTIRMYNVIKQSKEHDPEGIFIKKWVPELENVAVNHIHEPWKMNDLEQLLCGVILNKDYPMPLVDFENSARLAKEKIWSPRKTNLAKEEKTRIVSIHTRNKNETSKTRNRKSK